MDITHLHLHVRDRERSIAFYQRWFGLKVTTTRADIAFLQGERNFLLALMDDADPAPAPEWFHFGVRCDSAAAVVDLRDAMQAAGTPIVKSLVESPAISSFRCADPDGHAIELYWQP